jgi:hypothetical protein
MRKLIVLLFVIALASLSMAQGFGRAGSLPPSGALFPSGSDTLVNADTVVSTVFGFSNYVGAITATFQFEKISGTSAPVKIYLQMKNSDLNWGVPWDSIATTMAYSSRKMINVCVVDSTNAALEHPAIINLSKKVWWRYHDYGRFIAITGSHTGKLVIKGRLRGQ